MPERLEYYRQQRDLAREQAELGDGDRDGWLRIAQEWQNLMDALSAQLDNGTGNPDTHILDL